MFTTLGLWAREASAVDAVGLAEHLGRSLQRDELSGWALVLSLGGGFLTALTPCVYPLIPVTVRFFGGISGAHPRRTVELALIYVLGMGLLYTALGTAFASANLVFGSFLAHPVVVFGLAMVCAAMGASMLGAFTVGLPSALSTRLSLLGGNTRSGALVMGLVSGVIAAPCTGPVLTVILSVVAQHGGTMTGLVLMSSFSAGLGLPFLGLAIFSGHLARLPHGGRWMEVVKGALATAMFVVSVYFLRLAVPSWRYLHVPGWAWAAGIAVGLGAAWSAWRSEKPIAVHLGKAGLSVSLAFLLSGFLFSSGDRMPPGLSFLTSLEQGLSIARAEGRPVMVDFTADWCQACQELEEITYADPRVVAEGRRFVGVQLDATEIDERMQNIFERYQILGLPTVLFIDSRGVALEDPRVTGFVEPQAFLSLMRRVR